MSQTPLNATVAINPSKVYTPLQSDAQKSIWTSDRHGKYYQPSYNGTGALAANQTGATTSAGLATTYVGLCVSNPAASTVNLVIQTVSAMINVSSSCGIGLIGGFSAAGVVTHTTPLTVYSTKLGSVITSPIIQGLADAACTIVGTPIWIDQFVGTVATTFASFMRDINGEIIVPPGGYVAIGTSIASGTAALFGKISWEEVPL